jgi:hypothetical protein
MFKTGGAREGLRYEEGEHVRGELALPAFQLDCRDWLVITPSESGLPDELGGAPLLAVLSTAVIDDDELRSVSAVLTIGLLDDDDRFGAVGGAGRVLSDAVEIVDIDDLDGTTRFLVPTPDRRLALLAEFTTRGVVDAEVQRRIEALMTSFRWAA